MTEITAAHTAHRLSHRPFGTLLPLLGGFREGLPPIQDPIDADPVDIDLMRTEEGFKARQRKKAWEVYRGGKSRSKNLRADSGTTRFVSETLPAILDAVRNLHPIFTSATVSGCFLYPGEEESPAWMDWHTNSDSPGWRLYANHAPAAKKSGFCYAGTDERVIDQPDQLGWNFRLFYAKPEYDPFWHCVYARQPRISIGFNLGVVRASLIHDLLLRRD